MSRIPTHTVEDAPDASRPLLEKIVQSTPMGRPANLHAQMAHSPAVLTAYTSLRAVLAEDSTFDPKVGAALTLATAAGVLLVVPPYLLLFERLINVVHRHAPASTKLCFNSNPSDTAEAVGRWV